MKVKEQLLTLQAYSPGKTTDEVKREYGLERIVKLASNENPYGSSPTVREAIINIPDFAIYPDGAATLVTQKVAKYNQVNEDQLIFTSGLDELIQLISRAILTPDSNTITAQETFSQYRHHAVIENAEIREVPLKNGRHDLIEMANQVDENTKVIWICNPNNPTGTYVSEEELKTFLKTVPKDVLVVMDEAYYEYVTADDYPQTIPLLRDFENMLVLRTFSKVFGLAAFRIGYGIGAPSLISKLDVARLPFNTSTLAQVAAMAALDDIEFVKKSAAENAKELQKYYRFFKEHNIAYYPSEANFIYFNIPGISNQEVFQQLLESGWIVRMFPKGIRITIGKEHDNDGLLKRLKEIIS